MMNETCLIPYQFTIDAAVAEWIHQKETTGGSRLVMLDGRPRTRTGLEYERTMASFRHFLARWGLDVLPISAQTDQEMNRHAIDIARVSSLWASEREPPRLKKDGTESHRFNPSSPVSASMYNRRLAIISSFYTFVQKHYTLPIPNPVKADMVERRKVQPYAESAVNVLQPEEIEQGLDSIDRSTSEGLRDYAILAVALYTGRRASELTGLRGQDVKLQGRTPTTRVMLTFRAKGDKKMHDLLDTETSAVLLDYLHVRFGKRLGAIPPDAPIWISYSRNATRGQAISIRTLSNIVAAHLPTSKVHAIRHSFAVGMIRSGAPITDLADHLGHTDIKITRIYTKELTVAENKYGDLLVKRFGIKRKKAR